MSQAHSFAAAAGSPGAGVLDGTAAVSRRPPSLAVPPLGSSRSPWIAAFLAFFPGLGSIYNGSYARGVAFFLSALGGIHLANRGDELWGFAVAFIWFFNVIDAYREARLIRAGVAQDLGAARLRPATSAAEGIGLGLLLLLLGVVSSLELLGYDVDWIFNLWPVGLILAGAWFIASAIRRMRAARAVHSGAGGPGLGSSSGGTGPDLDSGAFADPPAPAGPPPHPPQGW